MSFATTTSRFFFFIFERVINDVIRLGSEADN